MKRWRSGVSGLVALSLGALSIVSPIGNASGMSSPSVVAKQPGAAQKTAAEGPKPQDNFTFLDIEQCRAQRASFQVESNELRGFAYNHFQWCATAKAEAASIVNGFRTGKLSYRLTVMATAPENDRTFTVFMFADKVHPRYLSLGMTGANTSVKFTPSCALNTYAGTCTFTPSATTPVTINEMSFNPVGITVRSEENFSGNKYGIMRGLLSFATTTTTTGGTILPIGINRFGADIRCDSANVTEPGKMSNPACIFTKAGPVLRLNVNDKRIDESALHIRQAQTNPQAMEPVAPAGVVKTIPTSLTRHWDELLNNDQRNASIDACKTAYGELPPGSGLDCDEYPFASTLEGSLAPVKPDQDKNYDFSVRRIKGADNQLAGSWFGAWYKKDRILPGDKFKVDIYDGPIVDESGQIEGG